MASPAAIFRFPATVRPGDGWRTALVLALAALAVQAVFLWETAGHIWYRFPVVDAVAYYHQAAAILQGGKTAGAFWQPPGYPYLLTVFSALGGGYLPAIRILQAAVLAPLTTLLVWRIARRLLPPAWAAAAAVAATVTGPLLFYQSQLLPAAPAALLVCGTLLLALRALERHTPLRWLCAGAVNGVAMLMVATTAAFVPVLALLACLSPGRWFTRALRVSVLLLGAGLAVLPVALRNFEASGRWVWISCNGGTNFYIGNNRDWEVSLTVQPGFDWDKFIRLPYERFGAKNDVEADRQFAALAWQDARRDPAAFAAGLARKAGAFWHGAEIPRNLDIYGWRESSRLLGATVWRTGIAFPTGLLAPLALLGVAGFCRRREVWLLSGACLAFGLLVAVYFPCSRYRVPLLPILAVLACAGVRALALAAQPRRRGFLALLLLLGALGGTAANLPLHWPTDRIRYDAHLWNAIGTEADMARNLPLAQRGYEEAIRRDPQLADAHFNLGTVYTRLRNPARAEVCFRNALKARADYDKARINLGILLSERGEIPEALRQFAMAEMLSPLNAEAYANHAAVLQQAGRHEEALEMLARAAELDPPRYRGICLRLRESMRGPRPPPAPPQPQPR